MSERFLFVPPSALQGECHSKKKKKKKSLSESADLQGLMKKR